MQVFNFMIVTKVSLHLKSHVFDVSTKIIKEEYGVDVVESLKIVASEKMAVLSLATLCKNQFAEVLSQQHGEYFGFGEHRGSVCYKVITTGIEMVRQCGDDDYHVNLKTNVKTVSRGNNLKRTLKLRC